MTHFIFSSQKDSLTNLQQAFMACGGNKENLVLNETGAGGSLIATDSLYDGLSFYRDQDFIYVVIGDPLLENHLFSTATRSNFKNWRTQAIAQLWDNKKNLLSLCPYHAGALIRINIQSGIVDIITDAGGYIPLYLYKSEEEWIIATVPDIIAAYIKPNLDLVSCKEKICSGQITFPYTLYEHIYQLAPASFHHIESETAEQVFWWNPPIEDHNSTVEEWQNCLKKNTQDFLDRLHYQVGSKGAILLSAGLDSRFIASMISETEKFEVRCINSTVTENLESLTAKKIAAALNLKFTHVIRRTAHYYKTVLSNPYLMSTQVNWHHAHFYANGLGQSNDEKFFIGGYMADILLTNNHEYIKRLKAREKTKPIRTNPDLLFWAVDAVAEQLPVKDQQKITHRRNHKDQFFGFHNNHCHSIKVIYPFKSALSAAHFEGTRQHYPIYEFFMTRSMLETGLQIPGTLKQKEKKRKLLAIEHRQINQIPLNPSRNKQLLEAEKLLKEFYPSPLWPDYLIFRGAWGQKPGEMHKIYANEIQKARLHVSTLLGLNLPSNQHHINVTCYEIAMAHHLIAFNSQE